MSAYEAVRIRLDPTPRQTRLLESHAGGARFAYNLMLAHVQRQISLGEKPDWTLYAMRRWWNEWKDEIAPWWRENSKEAYGSAFEWLSQALRNWSDSRKGRRGGRRVGWPKYKSKRSSVPRFAYTTGSFGLIEDDPKALKLPRIGRVHCMENATERVHGRRIVRMTVSRHAGFWYAALTVERPTESVPAKNRKRKNRNRQVGVDLGVKTLATLLRSTRPPAATPGARVRSRADSTPSPPRPTPPCGTSAPTCTSTACGAPPSTNIWSAIRSVGTTAPMTP